jgi:hypothetical protein
VGVSLWALFSFLLFSVLLMASKQRSHLWRSLCGDVELLDTSFGFDPTVMGVRDPKYHPRFNFLRPGWDRGAQVKNNQKKTV